ncbi:MAG: hypothetical protein RMJ16_12085 [Thermoguttaceae bacterium]|nr:hypothetical protein [Thermoguttaceae bacterium]
MLVLWAGCGGRSQSSSQEWEGAPHLRAPAELSQQGVSPKAVLAQGVSGGQEVRSAEGQGEVAGRLEGDSAQPFPPEIAQAWAGAGAEVGWVGIFNGMELEFSRTKESLLEELPDYLRPEVKLFPVFRFQVWPRGVVAKLPTPPGPFALHVSSPIADEDLKEVTGLENLRFLVLRSTRITDAGQKKLEEALPKCKIVVSLFLSGVPLSSLGRTSHR